jgi:RHS repeat-associated protein
MLTLQAVETGGASETTKWIYGITTTGGSDINSNSVLATVQYPDPSTGSPSSTYQESYTVNALGQNKTYTDKAGNVHTYTLDVLGRVTSDAITTLATGFDNAVLRIDTAYDTQGNPYLITSYNAATGGSIVNQVQRAYNGLGQMTQEWQSHTGAVNTSTTPSVQYGYTLMSGGVNNSRQTSITYPNGKVLTIGYGTSGSLNDTISRIDNLSDSSGTLEQYSYLGLDTVVKRAHSQPGVDLTYIKQSGESNGDAGDQYIGLDRFGRVADQRWIITSSGSATDRFQYGYDRDGNALYRNNLVNTNFGELYHASGAGNGYDNLNQLSGFLRGVLTASGGSGTPLDTISSPSHTQTFTPDAMGNFSTVTTDGTGVNRTHNQQNEVTGVGANTLVFDKNGNMTTDEQGRTLVYDAWNRLVAVKNGGTTLASYKFDGIGRRIVETAGANTRDLFFDSWSVVEERLNGASTADMQYVWNPLQTNSLVLRDRSTAHNGTLDERLWLQQNANGDVMALVNGSGSIVERYAYDPYGLVTYLNATFGTLSSSAYAANYLFQGERLDPATKLFHMDRRDYSPTLQRFVGADPTGFNAGDINFYRFTGNSPVDATDPSGLRVATDVPGGTLILYPETGQTTFIPMPPGWSAPQPGGYAGGWWNPGNWARGLYTGDPNCPDVIYDDALQENANHWIDTGELADVHDDLELLGPPGVFISKIFEDAEGEDGHAMIMNPAGRPKDDLQHIVTDGLKDVIPIVNNASDFLQGLFGWCFPAGTLVHTATGLQRIETVKAGQEVWAYDLIASQWRACRVLETFTRLYEGHSTFVTVEGETIESTLLHPYWVVSGEGLAERPRKKHLASAPAEATTPGRWVDAGDLQVGDELLLRDGRIAKVKAVKTTPFEAQVYNFRVHDLHCYAVGRNGVLVHNENGAEAVPDKPERPSPNTNLPDRVTGELPDGDVRTPEENEQARNFYKRYIDDARQWWSDRNGGQDWPTNPDTGAPQWAEHPRPLKDGGDPLFIEPGVGNNPNAPHMIPGPDGLTDQQRWGGLGGRPRQ